MTLLTELLLSDTAMVLAAGLGTRMRPLTLEKPKPLFEVGGRSMLDHALDRLLAAGIRRAVVNVFYLPDQIENHLEKRSDMEIIISRESELLDTGGGIKNALRHFGGKPFFALNADLPWMDAAPPHPDPFPPAGGEGEKRKSLARVAGEGRGPSLAPASGGKGEGGSLERMKDAWNPGKMDVLLLLMERQKARGFGPNGDFMMESDGRVWRKGAAVKPYVMLSAQILKPELFAPISEKIFSNNKIWDRAEEEKKLYGVAHEGSCYHVGTPEDLADANDLLASGQGWGVS